MLLFIKEQEAITQVVMGFNQFGFESLRFDERQNEPQRCPNRGGNAP